VTKDHGATVSDGSPLVALHAGPPAFTRLFWVEQKETYADSLRAHQAAHPNNNISVYQGDANARVDDVLTELPRVYPVFAFLDPRGPELSWQTVRKLASHKATGFPRVELLILFAYNMALARLMPHRPELMVNEHELDRFMPDRERWREIYAKRSLFTAPVTCSPKLRSLISWILPENTPGRTHAQEQIH